MGIGDPIGRSAGNPSKPGARRRFSIDERMQHAPALDETTFQPEISRSLVERCGGSTFLLWCLLVTVLAVLLVLLV